MNAQEMADFRDAITAEMEGRGVQVKHPDENWRQFLGSLSDCAGHLQKGSLFRPMRQPKARPWSKPEDVPAPVCWIRGRVLAGEQMIVKIEHDGIGTACGHGFKFGKESVPEWYRFADYEYSTDRKTWHKCEVTE